MSCSNNIEALAWSHNRGSRSHSAQGLAAVENSPAMKIPLPPRMWITDIEDESSDGTDISDEMVMVERSRVRSRFRHHKQRSLPNMPIGIFWDIENCQVPRGCSAIDVVSAIRAKFLGGRREADFVVVCDVRKEAVNRLQELNDAQVSLIHVCGTQKNAADEKLRQCMRRFGELHAAPAALLLISGDINFAGDLSDFRHRKNMEVILVHKQNTSSALIACASSHYSYNDLTANLPRNPKKISHTDHDEVPTCEMEILNLPVDQPPERVSRRLRRLADNCGGKVLRVTASTAMLRFPTPDHASRALKRMDGEDVFGRKIGTRYARSVLQPTYSSDEGYSTAPAQATPRAATGAPVHQVSVSSSESAPACSAPSTLSGVLGAVGEWALALQQLPEPTPPPHQFCPPPAPRPRKIRGTHGSASLDRSGCSSSNSGDDSRREHSLSRAVSPWNCSASLSEHSETDDCAELTVTNLPPYELPVLQEMLTQLFNKYVPVVRAAAWTGTDGPLGVITLRSEWDARLAIARIHKRRLENHWNGRRLELTMGRPTPTANLDVLRVRLRALLLEQPSHHLPLLRLRDAYASRHCCALTTADLAKIRDTVYVHEGFGRLVQLVDLRPVSGTEAEEGPWQCRVHAGLSAVHEDGSRVLRPVYMEAAVLARHTQALLESHGGVLPLLSFVECYEAQFAPLMADPERGVPLELLLRNAPTFELRDNPSRHLAWRVRPLSPPAPVRSNNSDSSRASDRGPRTAPVLEPMLLLFERELVDLLRSATRCCIPFSKLIPAFHHHFGRQCRVADYGFTKLPDLLAALSNTIVVLGSGSSRVITLSAVAQARRWTTDLVKLLKAQPGRVASLQDIPPLYQLTFGKPFSTVDYGVCTLPELMQRVLPEAVVVADGTVSLPRPSPTPEEKARILQFSMQAVELLCHTPTLSMEFSRFVPAYHAHFGRQLRVGHYGCVKLADLLEAVPGAVLVAGTCNGERVIRLARRMALTVIGQRLRALAPVFLSELPALYAAQFGAAPQPEALGLASLAALVFACGGCVERGVVRAPGDAPHWATAALTACSVLAADRSVARGSTQEYFVSAFRRIRGCEPEISNLEAAGVIEVCDRRVQLSGAWRAVWRVATLLCEGPRTAGEVLLEYTRRYEPSFCADVGVDGMCDFLRSYSSVFLEVGGETGALWTLCSGVTVAHCLEYPPLEDYSVHDTPPGQKGSRVFESPKTSLWCSPPASALPAPTALLPHENKRRTRLAAQFDAA